MTSTIKRRRPRRQQPVRAASLPPTPPAPPVDVAPPDEQPPARKPMRPAIVAIEQYQCPACESVMALQDVTSVIGEHPTMATLQRTVTLDCQHCGQVHVAKLMLSNAVWSPESCELLKRSA